MKRHPRAIFASTLVLHLWVGKLAFTPGCDRALRLYESVEVGKPLPKDGSLKPVSRDLLDPSNSLPSTKAILGWGDRAFWPLPPATGEHIVGAQIDANGLLVAKTYYAEVWSNYLLVNVPALRLISDVRVPEGLPVGQASREADPWSAGQANNVRQFLCTALQQYAVVPPSIEFYRLKNLAGANFGPGFSAMAAWLGLCQSVLELPLDGLLEPGFDRTFRPEFGGSIRIRTFPHRHVRIELNLIRPYDPMGLVGYLYAAPSRQKLREQG